MTEKETTLITEMRGDGLGYTTIASRLGLSKDCVRSYCRTHGLGGKRSPTHVARDLGKEYCKTCGRRLEHTPGKRKKRFCSDKCRIVPSLNVTLALVLE